MSSSSRFFLFLRSLVASRASRASRASPPITEPTIVPASAPLESPLLPVFDPDEDGSVDDVGIDVRDVGGSVMGMEEVVEVESTADEVALRLVEEFMALDTVELVELREAEDVVAGPAVARSRICKRADRRYGGAAPRQKTYQSRSPRR